MLQQISQITTKFHQILENYQEFVLQVFCLQQYTTLLIIKTKFEATFGLKQKIWIPGVLFYQGHLIAVRIIPRFSYHHALCCPLVESNKTTATAPTLTLKETSGAYLEHWTLPHWHPMQYPN